MGDDAVKDSQGVGPIQPDQSGQPVHNGGEVPDGSRGEEPLNNIFVLQADIREAIKDISNHLNLLNPMTHRSWKVRLSAWWQQLGSGQRDPVRIKNLEKVVVYLGLLHDFLEHSPELFSDNSLQHLSSRLEQLKKPAEIAFNMTWEMADMLEGELLRIGEADYIKGIWQTWPRRRIPEHLRDAIIKRDLDLSKKDDTQRLSVLVRPWLLEDQRDLAQEYRRDRAMITMRRNYLNIIFIVLLFLDLLFCWAFITIMSPLQVSNPEVAAVLRGTPTAKPAATAEAEGTDKAQGEPGADASAIALPEDSSSSNGAAVSWSVLVMVMTAGAIGSVLARATRLSQQPLPGEASASKGNELPLGVRALLSNWSVFWAQVMLGATAALMIYLVFSSGLLNIEAMNAQTPATLAVLSFMAGYSEPFLLNVVGKISERVA
jgi:hypothetical protein